MHLISGGSTLPSPSQNSDADAALDAFGRGELPGAEASRAWGHDLWLGARVAAEAAAAAFNQDSRGPGEGLVAVLGKGGKPDRDVAERPHLRPGSPHSIGMWVPHIPDVRLAAEWVMLAAETSVPEYLAQAGIDALRGTGPWGTLGTLCGEAVRDVTSDGEGGFGEVSKAVEAACYPVRPCNGESHGVGRGAVSDSGALGDGLSTPAVSMGAREDALPLFQLAASLGSQTAAANGAFVAEAMARSTASRQVCLARSMFGGVLPGFDSLHNGTRQIGNRTSTKRMGWFHPVTHEQAVRLALVEQDERREAAWRLGALDPGRDSGPS